MGTEPRGEEEKGKGAQRHRGAESGKGKTPSSPVAAWHLAHDSHGRPELFPGRCPGLENHKPRKGEVRVSRLERFLKRSAKNSARRIRSCGLFLEDWRCCGYAPFLEEENEEESGEETADVGEPGDASGAGHVEARES